jgi:mannose-1-phosphate guanylyltransferase
MSGPVVGMVLCAGLGTRMRPLTDLLPKPAVPVAGLPAVRWALALLSGAGIRRVVVNAHHHAEAMARVAAEAAGALGMELAVSREPVLAGTGGALREARGLLAGASEIVLLNGDTLFEADLPGALAAHRRSGALATMVLAPMPPGAGYAAVEADSDLEVVRIAGRGRGQDRSGAGEAGPAGAGIAPWHFTGCHVLSPPLLELVPATPFDCDVNRHVYPPLLDGRVRGHVDRGAWRDLGTPGGSLAATLDVLHGRLDAGRFPGADPRAGLAALAPGVLAGPGVVVDRDAVLRAPVLLGAGTRVDAGAEVGPAVAVGRDCRIGAGARLRECEVWAGTAVAAGERLARVIAAGALRVVAEPWSGPRR